MSIEIGKTYTLRKMGKRFAAAEGVKVIVTGFRPEISPAAVTVRTVSGAKILGCDSIVTDACKLR